MILDIKHPARRSSIPYVARRPVNLNPAFRLPKMLNFVGRDRYGAITLAPCSSPKWLFARWRWIGVRWWVRIRWRIGWGVRIWRWIRVRVRWRIGVGRRVKTQQPQTAQKRPLTNVPEAPHGLALRALVEDRQTLGLVTNGDNDGDHRACLRDFVV